jgi:hypothetical protein
MRGAEVGRRGRHPAFLTPHALDRLDDRHVTVALHEELGGHRGGTLAPWALGFEVTRWPVGKVV